MTMPIERKTDGRDECTIVSLHGTLDFYHSVSALKLLLENVRRHGCVLADLSAVTHIDSSGVASIVEAHQTAKQNGTRFALAGVNQQVMRMLELTRLDQALSIHASGAERLNELSQTRPQVRFGPRRNQRGSGCAPVPVR